LILEANRAAFKADLPGLIEHNRERFVVYCGVKKVAGPHRSEIFIVEAINRSAQDGRRKYYVIFCVGREGIEKVMLV